MLLLKIANKSFFSHNVNIYNHIKHLSYNIYIAKFVDKEIFSFFMR